MERWFKTEEGQRLDVVDHCIEQIKALQNLKLYISTDSQNMGPRTIYSTAIVFRYGTKGAHFISKTITVPRIKDNFSRLFKEAELTIEAADLIGKEIPIKFEALEFDYNDRLKTESTKVIQAATGWATSLGYNTVVKPGEMIAAKAADHVVRRESEKFKRERKRYIHKKGKK